MSPMSMTGYLEVVSPHLDPLIAGQDALSRLRAVGALLPPCSLAGLEVRLADHRPNVDFFVRLPYVDPGLPPALLAHPVWQALERLCGEVASPSGSLHDIVRHVILEFDLDAPPPPVPIPGLFLELNADRSPAAADLLELARVLERHRLHAGISPETLDRCVTALPGGANVAHLGFMLSRPGNALRLAIQGMPPAEVSGYLDALGWTDPEGRLASLVDEVSAIADPVSMLDIDVGHEVCPRVGVEFYLRREAERLPRWKTLFAFLVDRGLASRAKTDALLAWPGFTQESAARGRWAENLALGDLLFRGMATSVFWRNINHLKLSYQPGLTTEAKIYLGFGHNWFPAGTSDGTA